VSRAHQASCSGCTMSMPPRAKAAPSLSTTFRASTLAILSRLAEHAPSEQKGLRKGWPASRAEAPAPAGRSGSSSGGTERRCRMSKRRTSERNHTALCRALVVAQRHLVTSSQQHEVSSAPIDCLAPSALLQRAGLHACRCLKVSRGAAARLWEMQQRRLRDAGSASATTPEGACSAGLLKHMSPCALLAGFYTEARIYPACCNAAQVPSALAVAHVSQTHLRQVVHCHVLAHSLLFDQRLDDSRCAPAPLSTAAH